MLGEHLHLVHAEGLVSSREHRTDLTPQEPQERRQFRGIGQGGRLRVVAILLEGLNPVDAPVEDDPKDDVLLVTASERSPQEPGACVNLSVDVGQVEVGEDVTGWVRGWLSPLSGLGGGV